MKSQQAISLHCIETLMELHFTHQMLLSKTLPLSSPFLKTFSHLLQFTCVSSNNSSTLVAVSLQFFFHGSLGRETERAQNKTPCAPGACAAENLSFLSLSLVECFPFFLYYICAPFVLPRIFCWCSLQ